MDNQAPILMSPSPSSGSRFSLSLILIVVLALGTLVFGITTIHAVGQAHTAKTTLNAAKQAAATSAAAAQKQSDDKAAVVAGESPFRTYTAPSTYGSFAINFPKDWSLSDDIEDSSTTPVTIIMQPTEIQTKNNTLDPLAAKVTLVDKQLSDYLKAYTSKKITQSNVTVSGIASIQLNGKLPDNRAITLVAVPVRDTTIVFDNENAAYAPEFQAILAQAKINP